MVGASVNSMNLAARVRAARSSPPPTIQVARSGRVRIAARRGAKRRSGAAVCTTDIGLHDYCDSVSDATNNSLP